MDVLLLCSTLVFWAMMFVMVYATLVSMLGLLLVIPWGLGLLVDQRSVLSFYTTLKESRGCKRMAQFLVLRLLLLMTLGIAVFLVWSAAAYGFYSASRATGSSCPATRDWQVWSKESVILIALVTISPVFCLPPDKVLMLSRRVNLDVGVWAVTLSSRVWYHCCRRNEGSLQIVPLQEVRISLRMSVSGETLPPINNLFLTDSVVHIRDQVQTHLLERGHAGHHFKLLLGETILQPHLSVYEAGITNAAEVNVVILEGVDGEVPAGSQPVLPMAVVGILPRLGEGVFIICWIIVFGFLVVASVRHMEMLVAVHFDGCPSSLLWCLGSVCV